MQVGGRRPNTPIGNGRLGGAITVMLAAIVVIVGVAAVAAVLLLEGREGREGGGRGPTYEGGGEQNGMM